MHAPLPRSFYARDPVSVARDLLGKQLIRVLPDERLRGVIVETEAYLGADDPASHGAHPMTPRTRVLFGPAGHAYVYAIRQHALLDVTTETEHTGGAVLIRAVLPVAGQARMRAARAPFGGPDARLASGPGNLCRAFHVSLALNGTDLTTPNAPLLIADADTDPFEVRVTPRIGITSAREAPLRFVIHASPAGSRP